MPAPTNEELKADLASLAATADGMLAKDPAGETGRAEGAPDGFSALPKEWQDYITQLEALVDDQDESFAAGMEGRPTKSEAEMSKVRAEAAALKEKLDKAENELMQYSGKEQEKAAAQVAAMLGEYWMKHPKAEEYAEKLYKLMEGGMEFADAKAMLLRKMQNELNQDRLPKGAAGLPTSQPGGSDSTSRYTDRVRGLIF